MTVEICINLLNHLEMMDFIAMLDYQSLVANLFWEQPTTRGFSNNESHHHNPVGTTHKLLIPWESYDWQGWSPDAGNSKIRMHCCFQPQCCNAAHFSELPTGKRLYKNDHPANWSAIGIPRVQHWCDAPRLDSHWLLWKTVVHNHLPFNITAIHHGW